MGNLTLWRVMRTEDNDCEELCVHKYAKGTDFFTGIVYYIDLAKI